jgi:hypothetical protein
MDAWSGEVLRRYPVPCCAEGPVAAAPDGSALYVLASEFSVPIVLEFDPSQPVTQIPRVFSVPQGTRDIAIAVPGSRPTSAEGGACRILPASASLSPLWGFLLALGLCVARRVRAYCFCFAIFTLLLLPDELHAGCLAPGGTLRVDEGPFQLAPPPSGTAPEPATVGS